MKNVGLISAVIYIGISLVASAGFAVAATLLGHTGLERYGGAFWVFLLSMIILMPLVIPMIKARTK
jgi:hypothetical protein